MNKKIVIRAYIIALGFLVFLLGGILSCRSSQHKYSDTPTTGNISISADETFKPVLDAELQVFHALYPYAHININYKTETAALNDLFRDSVRLIISSRPLKKEEIDFFNEKKFFPKSIKIAIDGLALIVNKENSDTLISVDEFRKIVTGKITEWKQLNPLSRLGSIKVVFDNKNSSTVRFILDSVCKCDTISPIHSAVNTNEEVIDVIDENRNYVGVIGVSWISDSDDSTHLSFLKKVKILWVSNDSVATSDNSYQPFQAYIAKGYYPLTRNIYLINSEPRTGLATGFAAFLASDRGQRIILKAGILPATQPYRIIEVNNNY